VNPELIRMAAVIDNLKKKGILIERFNLTSAPEAFVANKTVNEFMKDKGVEALPISVLDGVIVISGRYPSNAEISELLHTPLNNLNTTRKISRKVKKSKGCCCGGGDCE
jgi:hypothetical protein